MSAQAAPQLENVPRPNLRVLNSRAAQLRTLPFALIMAMMLGLGMWGILVLNTVIQDQSATLVQLQREARILSYHEASLRATAEQLEASTSLAEKATALGMVPNPRPAFLNVETGEFTGDFYRVTGGELPNQTYRPLIVPAKPEPKSENTAAAGAEEADQTEADEAAVESPAADGAEATAPTEETSESTTDEAEAAVADETAGEVPAQ